VRSEKIYGIKKRRGVKHVVMAMARIFYFPLKELFRIEIRIRQVLCKWFEKGKIPKKL
jgi:hypothetical protein